MDRFMAWLTRRSRKSQRTKQFDEEDEVWDEVFGYWMDERHKG